MKKPYRYIIYLMIGVAIYFMIGADENPEVLTEFHGVAPIAIVGVVLLLMVVRYMIAKKNNGRE